MRSALTFEEIVLKLDGKLSKSAVANQLNVLVKWKEVIVVEINLFGSKVKFYGLVGRCNKKSKKIKKEKSLVSIYKPF